MWNDILFDLDGTLTDPGEGITGSVCHAMRQMGHPVPDQAVLNTFVGPPLNESFADVCGFDEEQIGRAVEHFRLYFAEHGIHQNVPFEGMAALLDRLVKAGRRLHIATTKPLYLAEQVLDMFDMKQYFTILAGSAAEHHGRAKAEVVAEVLERGHIDPAAAVMVGDRKYDVEGAHQNKLPCVGVSFGYAEPGEFEAAGADYVVDTVAELGDLLLAH